MDATSEFTETCSGFGLKPTPEPFFEPGLRCGVSYGVGNGSIQVFAVAADGTASGSHSHSCTLEGGEKATGLNVRGVTAQGIQIEHEFPAPTGC